MIRAPAAAGRFYPESPQELDRTVRRMTRDIAPRLPARGIVVPHAGYMYSGAVAGEVYSSVDVRERQVLFCPNHTGSGPDAAIMTRGTWKMPWGNAPIDEELAERLLAASALLTEDDDAHRWEHSLEVQLPFLRRFRESFRFVPIALAALSLSDCRSLGESAAACLRDDPSPPLLIASSDMTHYEPDAAARRKDEMAIERVLALDPEGLYGTVRRERISMCGVIPVTVMLYAAKALGASEARLIKYATSGDAAGDYRQVVGYAGLAIL